MRYMLIGESYRISQCVCVIPNAPSASRTTSCIRGRRAGDGGHWALCKVNTGLREQEVCRLRWDYEAKVPELYTAVFVIPGERVKNGEERLVVLNRVARPVIERLRGLNPVHVFVHACKKDGDPRPVTKINNTAWKAVRERAADAWQEGHCEAPA